VISISSNLGDVTVRLGAWVSKVRDAGRRELYGAAANSVAILVRDHIANLGRSRHKSADRLGAEPTKFLGKAAQNTTWRADETSGTVTIPAPGFNRAFRDIEILPRSWRFLTIPAVAESYGMRAGRLQAQGWKIWRPKGRKFLMGSIRGKDAKILYWLKESVVQKKDRSLLPSDAEMRSAAAGAMMETIRRMAT